MDFTTQSFALTRKQITHDILISQTKTASHGELDWKPQSLFSDTVVFIFRFKDSFDVWICPTTWPMYNSGALAAIFSLLFVWHAVRSTVQNRSSIWPRLLRRPHVKCQSFLRSWKPLPCHARFLSSRCDKKRKRPICFCEFLCPPARAKINYTNQDVLCRHSPGSRCVLQKAFIGNWSVSWTIYRLKFRFFAILTGNQELTTMHQ